MNPDSRISRSFAANSVFDQRPSAKICGKKSSALSASSAVKFQVSCTLRDERKRMGSGDPSGLQNRRELALLALVSSTLTRFRQLPITCGQYNPFAIKR
jgi:hypothetical protein